MASSYGDHELKVLTPADGDSRWATAIAVEAGTGDITGGLWSCMSPFEVTRLMLHITVTLAYDTQVVEGIVTFFKRITYGSNTGRVTLGTVRLINGTTAGQTLYVDINPHMIDVGEQVVAAITTAGTGGGAIAGDFLPAVGYDFVPEALGNQTQWVSGAAA